MRGVERGRAASGEGPGPDASPPARPLPAPLALALASLALLLAACCAPAAGTSPAAGTDLALRAELRSRGGSMIAWPAGGGAPIVLEDPDGLLRAGWDGRPVYLRLRPALAGGAPRVVVAAAPVSPASVAAGDG